MVYDILEMAIDWVRGIIGYFEIAPARGSNPRPMQYFKLFASTFLTQSAALPSRANHRLPGESKRAIAGVGSSSSSACVAVAGEVDYGVGGDRIEAISGGLDRQVEVPAQDEAHQIQ